MATKQLEFLYIEDHAASRDIMEILLVDVLGFSAPTMLQSTEDVIGRLEATEKTFNVIFLDINIEPFDGLATCAMLRAHSRFRRAKIIAMTAEDSPAELKRIRTAGFDGLICKPLSPLEFPSQVAQILSDSPTWEVS